jgi:hypothetical protein
MSPSRSIKLTGMIAGLLLSMLLAILAVPLGAQPADEPGAAHPWLQAYDKAREITIDGTIQAVITHHVLRSPVGLHLIVNAPQGTFDAHLGPYMSKKTIEALHPGASVQIIGAVQQINGKEYLLVREISFGDRTVTVRTDSGFLVRTMGHGARAASETEPDGGAR